MLGHKERKTEKELLKIREKLIDKSHGSTMHERNIMSIDWLRESYDLRLDEILNIVEKLLNDGFYSSKGVRLQTINAEYTLMEIQRTTKLKKKW
jgi:hypothetical protein